MLRGGRKKGAEDLPLAGQCQLREEAGKRKKKQVKTVWRGDKYKLSTWVNNKGQYVRSQLGCGKWCEGALMGF